MEANEFETSGVLVILNQMHAEFEGVLRLHLPVSDGPDSSEASQVFVNLKGRLGDEGQILVESFHVRHAGIGFHSSSLVSDGLFVPQAPAVGVSFITVIHVEEGLGRESLVTQPRDSSLEQMKDKRLSYSGLAEEALPCLTALLVEICP